MGGSQEAQWKLDEVVSMKEFARIESEKYEVWGRVVRGGLAMLWLLSIAKLGMRG